jgi:serine/threonine-protein kinase
MAKKPADRFASTLEFRDALTRAPSDASPLARSLSRPAPRANDAQQEGVMRASSAWKHAIPPDAAAGGVRDAIRAMRQASGASRPRNDRHPGRIVRDAVEAANAGWRSGLPVPSAPGGPLAPVPPWMPPSWRDARRQWRGQHREALEHRRGGRVERSAEASLADRIRSLRRRTASTAITVGMLAAINLITSPEFPWFLFPAIGLSIGLLHRGAGLWADGIRFKDIFGREARRHLAEAAANPRGALPLSPTQLAEKLAPPDVVAGAQGTLVMRAAQDRQTIHEAVGKLSKADKELIPDVLPTVDALADRVGSLALALHRLDEDVRPGAVEDLDHRIEMVRAQPESKEREQKLQLLERQRLTVNDLMSRRGTLVSQLESASLMLQNMRLDLIALRSAGIQSVLNDVSSATQEARALSREIGHVLDAAKEVR